eukprot:Skav220621  [mRNA]  locus=scaffold112:54171:55111:- [translate_table: standard]
MTLDCSLRWKPKVLAQAVPTTLLAKRQMRCSSRVPEQTVMLPEPLRVFRPMVRALREDSSNRYQLTLAPFVLAPWVSKPGSVENHGKPGNVHMASAET